MHGPGISVWIPAPRTEMIEDEPEGRDILVGLHPEILNEETLKPFSDRFTEASKGFELGTKHRCRIERR